MAIPPPATHSVPLGVAWVDVGCGTEPLPELNSQPPVSIMILETPQNVREDR
jgi:hypothetical protein